MKYPNDFQPHSHKVRKDFKNYVMSQNNLASPKRKSNRNLLILFILALAIAILPWFLLAESGQSQECSKIHEENHQ
ncbi:hypothetical protein DQQ10_18085 [Pseudochryseolinea flava]|uniref:Uncharacterized protein n=1 Tax=Pseudochryseolinea flava TaxID=2059302 RepID=A0A364Y0A7_9BACT|nr:hypothetical protein DQQ10_18085 [Pseudochryseolinea flava]